MLKQILEKEHLIDYILDILELKHLYNCKNYTKILIYNNIKCEDPILYIDDFLVNQYSIEDYLHYDELFNQLEDAIDCIKNADLLAAIYCN